MRNPTRRNRNIGTAKQGYGQNNKLVIPEPNMEYFVEQLGEYKTVEKFINGHKFKFVIEKTRKNSFHACTIEDVEKIIAEIPKEDYGELGLIIFRQPTRKQEMLKPVWGRLIYSHEFENDLIPAVIIEAMDLDRVMKWSKKLSIEDQKELERLKEDGHPINIGKRFYEIECTFETIRSTQLYRTLLHEFGHYVHYLEVVERPETEEEDYDAWDNRYEFYHSLSTSEKEVFAHAYADKLKKNLMEKGIIPFDRILNENQLLELGLNLEDFKKQE